MVGNATATVTRNVSIGPADESEPDDRGGGFPIGGGSGPSDNPASFAIDVVDRPSTVDAGAPFSVAVDVANTGEQSDSTDVALEIDGEELAASSVELDGGENTQVTLEATAPDATGEVELAVSTDDDRSTAALSVADASPGTGEETSEAPAASEDGADGTSAHERSSSDGTPGFGVAAAFVGLLGGVAALRRRRAE